MTVGIIDFGMGNLSSVANAFERLECSPILLTEPAQMQTVDRLVLPGVGAFGDGMANLNRGGWIPALEAEVRTGGKPFLGLCLGMQLLATSGQEHGDWQGLGWIPGVVRRFATTDAAIRIPHMGWNDVEIAKHDGIYKEAKGEQTFYFVHSFIFCPEDTSVVSAWCQHGERFVASVEQGNIFATQYHPEKSQKCGLSVLRNFLQASAC